MTSQLPGDAVTAEAIDAFTVGCAKASSVPGASAGDCYRAGLAAALPALTVAITAQATTAERERVRAQLLDVVTSHAASGNDWLLSELLTAIRELGDVAGSPHTPGGAT